MLYHGCFDNVLPFEMSYNCSLAVSVGNDTYGVIGIPSAVGGCGVVQRAGLAVSTQIVYPGSGRGDV